MFSYLLNASLIHADIPCREGKNACRIDMRMRTGDKTHVVLIRACGQFIYLVDLRVIFVFKSEYIFRPIR